MGRPWQKLFGLRWQHEKVINNPNPGPYRRGRMGLTIYLLFLEHETMILTITYTRRLIKLGKATIVATVTHDGVDYYVIDRHDLQRTDHAEVPA